MCGIWLSTNHYVEYHLFHKLTEILNLITEIKKSMARNIENALNQSKKDYRQLVGTLFRK